MKKNKQKNEVRLKAVAQKKTSKENGLMSEINLFLTAVSDKNRLNIMHLVKNDFLSVTQIYKTLRITQNLTSHHIGQLKKAKLLTEKKEGTFRFYKLNEKQLKKSVQELEDLFGIK